MKKRIVYFGSIITAIIVIALFSGNIFSQLNQHHIEMQISNDEAVTYRIKEHIVERFYKAQLDTVFVASFLEEHLKSVDADSPNEIENVKTELNDVVPSLLKVNSIFSDMSFIDRDGEEPMTINIDGFAGKPLLDELIRSKCFKGASAHKEGEVYTTFDNNSIYLCTPFFNESAELLGVIVMVSDKYELLKELKPITESGNIIIMEDTGKYILTSNRHAGKINFLDEFPKSLFSKILSTQSGNLEYEKNTLMTYLPLALDDRQWFLLLSTDKGSVTAQLYTLYEQLIIVITLAVIAIVAAIIFLFGSRKKEEIAKQEKKQNEQLEDINKQLHEKQYSLEEQNSVIEELNSQLEDENARYMEQKDILQAIIDSLGAGIIMTDISGKITFINKAWKEIFEYIDLNMNSHTCENFYIEDDLCGNSEKFLKNIMAGMENSEEILAKLLTLIGDGVSSYAVDMEQTSPIKRFVNLYSNPCISYTNNTYGRVFVIRDISHQKEVDRLKLELISTVSHELRTPMSSILGFSELLLTRKLTEGRNKEYIGIINSEARRLTDLINDFLDIQRMESGKLLFNKQSNSMDQIIGEAIKLFENSMDKHIIVYEKSAENIVPINCDREKILQVFSNLISNAIKYSPDGGEIKVDLIVENGKLKVSISDHGLGIPEDVIDKLFAKFFRVDNDDRKKIGGTGLGLAICKEIIQAHGGEIGVESKYGIGSTFYFYLPYIANNAVVKPKGKIGEGSLNYKGKLLIVEDDVSMVRLIKEILKDEGLQMYNVSSGEEAIKFAERNPCKLIILDIALSGRMSGWDVLKELKEHQTTSDTPIIISSCMKI